MKHRSMKAVLSLSIALSSSACAWSKFDDLEAQATVRTFDVPESYRVEKYGAVIATYQGKAGAKDVSRLIASAGLDSPVVITNVWTNGKLGESNNIRCKREKDCSMTKGLGKTLIPFETWLPGTAQEHSGCVYAPGYPSAYIFCETNPGKTPVFNLKLPEETEFPATTWQFSGASLPVNHPLGIALVGVYAVSDRTGLSSAGKLYYQPNAVTDLHKIPLLDPATQAPFHDAADAADLGYAVAAAPNAQGELVFAVSQPSKNLVIVGTFDDRIVPPPSAMGREILASKFRTRACLTAEDPNLKGIGKRLTMGDINNDGQPELLVGIDPLDGQNGDLQRVWMYPGTGLPPLDENSPVCPLWAQKPVQVGCIDGIRGVDCEGSGFGASLAIGDVNGDQLGDLLIGAPLTTLQGEKKAGVAWLIPGSAAHPETHGLDFENMTNLYASNFEANGLAGTAVGFVRTDARDEPVVGAPGSERLYMFMCTDLEEGESLDGLCLPK